MTILSLVLTYGLYVSGNWLEECETSRGLDKTYFTRVSYDNLEQSEVEHFEEILDDVKEIYFMKNPQILVVRNISNWCDDCASNTLGINIWDGKTNSIIMEYTDGDFELKRILCHEILHSFMYRDEETHDVIKDIEDYQICYKRKNIIFKVINE